MSRSPANEVPEPEAVICTPNCVLFTFAADHTYPQPSLGPPKLYVVGTVVRVTCFGVPSGTPACKSWNVNVVGALTMAGAEYAMNVTLNPEIPFVNATENENP